MADILDSLLAALQMPGGYTRGLLGGRLGDQLSGEALGSQWGLWNKGQTGMLPALGGLALGAATDPLTWLGGLGALGIKGLGAAGEAATAAKSGKIAEMLAPLLKAAQEGKPLEQGAEALGLGSKAPSGMSIAAKNAFTANTPDNIDALEKLAQMHTANAIKEAAATGHVDAATLEKIHGMMGPEHWDALGVQSPYSRIAGRLRELGHDAVTTREGDTYWIGEGPMNLAQNRISQAGMGPDSPLDKQVAEMMMNGRTPPTINDLPNLPGQPGPQGMQSVPQPPPYQFSTPPPEIPTEPYTLTPRGPVTPPYSGPQAQLPAPPPSQLGYQGPSALATIPPPLGMPGVPPFQGLPNMRGMTMPLPGAPQSMLGYAPSQMRPWGMTEDGLRLQQIMQNFKGM